MGFTGMSVAMADLEFAERKRRRGEAMRWIGLEFYVYALVMAVARHRHRPIDLVLSLAFVFIISFFLFFLRTTVSCPHSLYAFASDSRD